jgi:hypothetical protein
VRFGRTGEKNALQSSDLLILVRRFPPGSKGARSLFPRFRDEKEFRQGRVQRRREFVEATDGGVFQAAFNSADIGPVNVGIDRQLFLRHASGDSQTAQIPGDHRNPVHAGTGPSGGLSNHGVYASYLNMGVSMVDVQKLTANKKLIGVGAAVLAFGAWHFLSAPMIACDSPALMAEFQTRFNAAQEESNASLKNTDIKKSNLRLNIISTTTLGKDGNMLSCQMDWDYGDPQMTFRNGRYRVGRNDQGDLTWQFEGRYPPYDIRGILFGF